MMSPAEQLRSTSELIRSFLEISSADLEAGIRSVPDHISQISEQIAMVGRILSDRNPGHVSRDELHAYCSNLKQLQATLAAIEERRRARRDLLLKQRQHLSSLGEWASNSRKLE